jgi:hypothetical protein
VAKNISRSNLSVLLTFIYWISYENTFFFESGNFGPLALFITNFIKLGIPHILLIINGIPIFSKKNHVFFYVLVFILFLAYALLPTLATGDIIEYLKLFPRFIFLVTALKIFREHKNILLFSNMVVGYVVFTFFQYIIGYTLIVMNIDIGMVINGNLMWYGPLGIFGNLTKVTSFFEFPFIQLRGFWNEPSNASGAIFATFFLTKFINAETKTKLPKYIPIIILIAGFLTFSLIGYVSFLCAFTYGLYFDFKRSGSLYKILRYLPVLIILVLYVFSRSIVSNGNVDNELLLAVTGAHKIVNKDEIDVSGGRYNVFIDDLNIVNQYPFGIGVQNVIGKAAGLVEGRVIIKNISASAPVFWFVLTGYIGLFLLLFREFFLFRLALFNSKNSKSLQYLFQAFLSVFIQNLSYGTFMTGYYIVLSCFVFGYIGTRFSNNNFMKFNA